MLPRPHLGFPSAPVSANSGKKKKKNDTSACLAFYTHLIIYIYSAFVPASVHVQAPGFQVAVTPPESEKG